MIIAFLNHKGGVGKTTLALHVAGVWVARGKHIVVLDTDAQGLALGWSDQRAKTGLTRVFKAIEFVRDTIHLESTCPPARPVRTDHGLFLPWSTCLKAKFPPSIKPSAGVFVAGPDSDGPVNERHWEFTEAQEKTPIVSR